MLTISQISLLLLSVHSCVIRYYSVHIWNILCCLRWCWGDSPPSGGLHEMQPLCNRYIGIWYMQLQCLWTASTKHKPTVRMWWIVCCPAWGLGGCIPLLLGVVAAQLPVVDSIRTNFMYIIHIYPTISLVLFMPSPGIGPKVLGIREVSVA